MVVLQSENTFLSERLESTETEITQNDSLSGSYSMVSRFATIRLLILSLLVSLVVSVSSIILSCDNSLTKLNFCALQGSVMGIFSSVSAIVFVVTLNIFVWWKTREKPDPYLVFRELKISTFLYSVISIVVGINIVILGRKDNDLKFSVGFLAPILSIILYYYTFPYQIRLSKKREYKSILTFDDVLNNEIAKKFFSLQLQYENSLENIEFYDSVLNWKNKFDQTLEEKEEAITIFQTFIDKNKVSSKNRILLRWELIENLKANLDKDDVTIDVFDDCLQEVKNLMEFDAFERFRSSAFYCLLIGYDREKSLLKIRDMDKLI